MNLLQAYALLKSLIDALPDGRDVARKFVDQYHEILSGIEAATQEDLNVFRIPADHVRPRLIFSSPSGNKYSSESYCDYTEVMAKAKAVLAYFELQYLEKKEVTVGFDTTQ